MAKKLLTQQEAVAILKAEKEKNDFNLTEFSQHFGVSKQYLKAILNGLMMPTEKVGFRKIPMFEPFKLKRNGARK